MADFECWAQESHALAKSTAYAGLEPHDTPGAACVTNARRVVRERVALAGYRLAALLHEIFNRADELPAAGAPWNRPVVRDNAGSSDRDSFGRSKACGISGL